MSFNWKCPFCGRHGVIDEDANMAIFKYVFDMNNKYGDQNIVGTVIVCPNEDCREYYLALNIMNTQYDQQKQGWNDTMPPRLGWVLLPESRVRVFPDYIPQPLLSDYREACLIRDKSPKASATLSRRCLQGMIRDFWKIQKSRLIDEIKAIRDKVDATTWEAIDSVRTLGNIGAHMEKDINLIVDVDPGEAGLLITLLETLFSEWYVARHDQQERMAKIKAAAAAKEAERKNETERPAPASE